MISHDCVYLIVCLSLLIFVVVVAIVVVAVVIVVVVVCCCCFCHCFVRLASLMLYLVRMFCVLFLLLESLQL